MIESSFQNASPSRLPPASAGLMSWFLRQCPLLSRLILWTTMIVLPHGTFVGMSLLQRLPADTSLLIGATLAMREFAANTDLVRLFAWLIGLAGFSAAASSAAQAFQPTLVGIHGVLRWVLVVGAIALAGAEIAAGVSFLLWPSVAAATALFLLLRLDEKLAHAAPPLSLPDVGVTAPRLHLAVIGLALLVYVPVIFSLNAPGYDESFSMLHYASFGPSILLARYDFPNNHIAFNFVCSLFLPGGMALLAIPRIISFLCFLALLVVAAELAMQIGGPYARLFTTAWLFLHGLLYFFAYQGRGYVMAMLFATLGWRFLASRRRDAREIHAPACYMIAVLVIPTWIGLFGVAAFTSIWHSRSRAVAVAWLLHGIAVAVWYTPATIFLAAIWPETYFASQALSEEGSASIFGIILRSLAGLGSALEWFSPLFVGLTVFGAWLSRNSQGTFLLANLAALGGLLGACLFLGNDGAAVRQLSMFIPFCGVMLGVALGSLMSLLPKRTRVIAALAVVTMILAAPLSLSSFYLGPRSTDESLQQVANLLRDQSARDDLIHASGSRLSARLVALMGPRHAFHALDPVLLRKEKHLKHRRIWLLVNETAGDLEGQLGRLAPSQMAEVHFGKPVLALTAPPYKLFVLNR